MEFCDICLNLDAEQYWLRRDGQKNVTKCVRLTKLLELQLSAVKGCPGCKLLAKSLEGTLLEKTDGVHILFEKGLPLRLESRNLDLELLTVRNWKLPSPFVGVGREVPQDITADAAAVFAKEQLRRCTAHHEYCSRLPPVDRAQVKPERLLYIGIGLSSLDIYLVDTSRLILENRSHRLPPYIALSYCWGPREANLTTTRENMNARRTKIDYHDLPKTLQDAVAVARSIGIEYMWIDSLCIIQNDDDNNNTDWRIESSKMGSIYEAATLTISVTSSAAVTEGFLGLRRETAVADGGGKVVKWTGFDGSEAHTLVRRRLPHSGIVSETSDPAGCPLLRRGWTLQERLLATRTLHFLPDEMLWECRSDFVCECSSVEADQRWKNGHLRGSLFNVSVSNPEGADWVALWQQLVKDYSKRQLTDEVDRLPALSGIAARFKSSNTRLGRYFAGLWESGILWQMTWQADWSIFVAASSMHATTDTMNHSTGTRHPQSTRSTAQPNSSMASAFSNPVGNYRKSLKPSWSWISTRNPVEWDMVGPELRSSSRIDAKLLYASCLADPMNPFGQVTAGEMLLEAHAFSTKILANDLGFIWKLENGAIMIPDVPNLQLVPGDTIHCALIYDRVKDGMLLWVGLALQRLSNNNSTGEGTERFYRVGLVKGTMHSSYLGTGLFRRQILIE